MKLVVIEMENKEKQKTKETDVVKPYTIRILPNNEDILDKVVHYVMDSKADKVIKFEYEEINKCFKELITDIREKKREVPKILKIKLDAHGWPGGGIFMGNKTDTICNYIYILGTRISKLLTLGVEKVYIKTNPCYGGCYVNTHNGERSVFQMIKKAIEDDFPKKKDGEIVVDKDGLRVPDKEKAKEFIDKVYCSTTRAGIGTWHIGRAHGHAHGYCQENDVPWYKKLRYELNGFLGTAYWTLVRWKQSRYVNWFSHMSKSKRKSMGVLIGSEGKIYFPLKDADEFGYKNYFKDPKNAKELHKKYSGPEAKKKAYEFLDIGYIGPKINNEEAKTYLGDKNMWKSYYTSGCQFPF